jgi:hypothetical protein
MLFSEILKKVRQWRVYATIDQQEFSICYSAAANNSQPYTIHRPVVNFPLPVDTD